MSKEAAGAAVSTECGFANGAAELWTEPETPYKEAAEAAISTKCAALRMGAAEVLRTEPKRPNMSKEAAEAAISTECGFANGAIFLLRK